MTRPNTINCPSCGGDVPIATQASCVAGCPYCGNMLVVNQDAIRALGKMSLLAETPSCLAVGWSALCREREIRVLGRIQYRYRAGLWDEWWVQFVDDESYAWISQDEDEYTLEIPLPDLKPPNYESIAPGQHFKIAGHKVWVEEKDQATMVGVQGELPLGATPAGTMRYVDLTDNRIKLTLEYFDDGTSLAFQGKYLKRKDLQALDAPHVDASEFDWPYEAPKLQAPPDHSTSGQVLSQKAEPVEATVVTASAGIKPESVSCPNCGGSVELRDQKGTAMVVCQFCAAALDVAVPGAAQLLYQSEQQRLPFPIAMGEKGRFKGVEWTVIGRVRYQEDDSSGVWIWEELQLYNPEHGYAFLALEDGHWMFFTPLRHTLYRDPRFLHRKQKLKVDGQMFTVFESSRAFIAYVEGELSWVARLGDKLRYMDAIRPPQMVSAEWTDNELEWSMGRYMPRQEVAAAFGKKANELPRPIGVAPAQPMLNPPGQALRTKIGWAASGLLFFLFVVTWMIGGGKQMLSTGAISSNVYLSERGFVSQPFDVPEGNHVCRLVARGSNLNNAWVGLTIAFLDQDEKVILDTDPQVEYYSGVEGGERWSEGSEKDTKLFRLSGPRTLRVNAFGEAGVWSRSGGDQKTESGSSVTIDVYRGVMPARYFLVAMILTLIYPVVQTARRILFETRRWPTDDD